MFEHITKCLDQFSNVLNGENAASGLLNAEERDFLDYFDFYLAKALINEQYVNAEKVAKYILVAKGLSGDIKIK